MQTQTSAPMGASQSKSVAPKARSKPRNQLGDLAQKIYAEHQAVLAAVRLGAEHAMAAGDLLLKARPNFAHGQWTDWVQRHCKMSDRTARVYIQLAENREAIESKRQHAADLDLSVRGALKAIAGPPKAESNTSPPSTSPSNEFKKKRYTKFELMAVWLETPATERVSFMGDVGLMFRRDVEALKAAPAAAAPSPAATDLINSIPADLSIPECLRRMTT